MNANSSSAAKAPVMARIARALALACLLGVPAAGALALDTTTVLPLEPLGGSISLPKPPRAFCPTLEKQCLRKCPPSDPTFGSFCALGCALERVNCDSGGTAFGYECNAPKGSGCL